MPGINLLTVNVDNITTKLAIRDVGIGHECIS